MTSSTLQQIEQAITRLSTAELDQLYSWLADYQPQPIDTRIETDFAAGRLDQAIHQALEDALEGNLRPL